MSIDIITIIVILAIIIVLCYLSKSWSAGVTAIGGVVGGAVSGIFGGFDADDDEEFEGGRKKKKAEGPREDKLFLADEWLEQVTSGKKKVEGRAAEKGAFDKWVGKPLKLYNDNNSVTVTVDKVVHYDNMKDFLDKEWELVAPLTKSRKAAETALRDIEWSTRKGEKFHPYTDERIAEKGGIEAIHMKVK